jgi:redox-sensitive bicupin YhaK (pirin superfamily)
MQATTKSINKTSTTIFSNIVKRSQSTSSMAPQITVVPDSKLFVTEPPAMWFGNPSNPSDDPAWTNQNWLKSRFHFSFAEYRNPANSRFGVMRVMNDDLVQPKRGFGTHPHGDMEIITYIVNGSLTHQDNIGSQESLGRGSIQFVTAGTGVEHSEFNHSEKPLRFIQTWIVPRNRGLAPNYGSYNASKNCETKKNELQYLASDTGNTSAATPVKVNQDIDTHAAELELGKAVTWDLPAGRQAYLLCVEGTVELNGKTLSKYDAAEIHGDGTPLEIKATGVEDTENGEVAHFIMFSMAEDGSGRKDLE